MSGTSRFTIIVITLAMVLLSLADSSRQAAAQVCVVHPNARLAPENAEDNGQFGMSVAMSGNVAVIGAPLDLNLPGQMGRAYVFRFDGNSWAREQILVPSDPSSNAGFSLTAALSGDTVFIGAPDDDEGPYNSGAVYVFRFNGRSWVQTQKLRPTNVATSDRFGAAIDVDGQTVVIGAPGHAATLGIAYVFGWNGSSWEERQSLFPPNGTAGTVQFGSSIAISGDLLAIGAPRRTGAAFACGAVYTYRAVNDFWTTEQLLLPGQPVLNGEMGRSVACEGNIITAGSQPQDGNWPVEVFAYASGQWAWQQRLLGQDFQEQFGTACAVKDGIIYVAAPSAIGGDNSSYRSGVVYQYTLTGGLFSLQRRMYTNAFDQSAFASSLATNGEFVLAGAPYHAPVALFSGAVYILPTHLPDCNANESLDDCELPDCNGNRVPDECELASGSLHDCDRNGIPDECEAPLNYVLDGGSSQNVWGLNNSGDYLWLNRFNVLPGAEVVSAIEIGWTQLTWENIPATLLIYKDPNNDGNPIDAVLLRSVQTLTRNPTNGTEINLQRVNIPPTFAGLPGDKFFVGALMTQPFKMPLAAADYTPPVHVNWRKWGASGTIDIHNLAVGNHVIEPVPRNWILRAIAGDCDADGISNQCEIDNGAADRNSNGIPDACERVCPPDLFPPSGTGAGAGGDGTVNIDDLAFLITHWDQTGSTADLNIDGTVNIDDLVLLITHWGACR